MQNTYDKQTIDYYNKNAIEYFNETISIDMASSYDRFLKYVPAHGRIVDIGAGSGRDVAYFDKQGYDVEGIEPSIELCKLASDYSGIRIENVSIQDWKPQYTYDGIWANASLVHLTKKEFISFIKGIYTCLNINGIVYFSVKSGMINERDLKGRQFLILGENELDIIISTSRELKIVEKWISNDAMNRQNINWINYIVGYKKTIT